MSRSHTRKRRKAARRARVSYLKHRTAKDPKRGKAKRQSSDNRRDEIQRTIKLLGIVNIEKGTDR